ncbi:MAG: cation:proton antiporter, partial [Candidatus Marsarchaeota archaeon]|nr:cation:proton antiporter [Candidatus Marsarchaeota archaeon]
RSESRIILGAAVIDDVLGLVLLAVVSGLAMHGSVSAVQITKTSLLAVVFLVGAILVGVPIAPHALNLIRRIPARGTLMVAAFLFCLLMSYVAHLIGLASIVGAFAAGLVLARTDDQAYLQDRIAPLADVFIPIFFVALGISVNLKAFSPSAPGAAKVLLLTVVLAAVAIAMKLFSGLGVLKRGVNRLVVGVGMIPRGEVGLIFASVGLTRAIITPLEYSAVVAVVAITTLATPGLLKLVLRKAGMLSEKAELE